MVASGWFVPTYRGNIKLGILWFVIPGLKKLPILRAEGHPCKAKYELDTRLNEAV
jgi:hypothetical protein